MSNDFLLLDARLPAGLTDGGGRSWPSDPNAGWSCVDDVLPDDLTDFVFFCLCGLVKATLGEWPGAAMPSSEGRFLDAKYEPILMLDPSVDTVEDA